MPDQKHHEIQAMPFDPQFILLNARFASRACEHCSDQVLLDELSEVICPRRFSTPCLPRQHWCSSCVRSSSFKCSDCGDTFHDDLSGGQNAIGDLVCDGCSAQYFVCVHCSKIYCNDYYGADGNCQGCDKASVVIKPYSYKDYGAPIGKGSLFFGIELEVEAGDNRDSAAEDVSSRLDDFGVLKEDGSIKSGFEIVTRPASMDEQRKGWKGFFTNLPEGLRSFRTETCGLHVHASRAALTPLQISKVVCFVNAPENRVFMELIAGRKACEWAKYHGKKLATASNRTGQRYEAVNLENANTIEFRVFKGTLKESSFWRCIEFCDALISFSAPASRTMGESLDWRAFARFVREGRKDWPDLHAFINERILGNVPNQKSLIKQTICV